MSITTGVINAPPSGLNPLLVAPGVLYNGNTGAIQFFCLFDPDSASMRPMQITANGIKVDGSAATQPISGSVSVSNFPATQPVSGAVSLSGSGVGGSKTNPLFVSEVSQKLTVCNATATISTATAFVCAYNPTNSAVTYSTPISIYDGTNASGTLIATIGGFNPNDSVGYGPIPATSGSIYISNPSNGLINIVFL